MLSRISKITVLLPVIAMAAASITYTAGMFPSSHDDTVPLFSLFFACAFSAAGLAMAGIAVLCAVGFCRLRSKRLQLLMLGILLLCEVAFSGLCLFVYGGAGSRLIAVFCITEGLLSALTAVLCMLSPVEAEQD